MPARAPVVALIVVTVVVPDVHVPPAGDEDSDEPVPGHSDKLPEIVPIGLTVTVVVRAQPVGNVYDMVDVPPDTPDTIPVADTTVATPVLLLVQVPPMVAQASVVAVLAQTVVVPVITVGIVLMVAMAVAAQPPGSV